MYCSRHFNEKENMNVFLSAFWFCLNRNVSDGHMVGKWMVFMPYSDNIDGALVVTDGLSVWCFFHVIHVCEGVFVGVIWLVVYSKFTKGVNVSVNIHGVVNGIISSSPLTLMD